MKSKILLVAALCVVQSIAQIDIEVITTETFDREDIVEEQTSVYSDESSTKDVENIGSTTQSASSTTLTPIDDNEEHSGNDEANIETTIPIENNNSNEVIENHPSETTITSTTTSVTITPLTPPEFTCTSVGRFAFPDSCEKYYYCWDTVRGYAIFSCNKVFDPVTKRCVENYALCPSAPKCEADKQVLPNPDDKSSFFECRLEKNSIPPSYEIRREECEHGREFNDEMGFCTLITPNELSSAESSSERIFCTRVGIWIDEQSDTHYFECIVKSVSKGILKAIKRKCPKYWVFSAADEKCIPL